MSPEQERTRITTGIKGSGPVDAAVQDVAKKAAEQSFRQTFGTSSDAAQFSGEAACFRGGCLIDVVYANSCFADRATRAAFARPASALLRWPGAIYKTPAVPRADKRFDVTWVFLLSAAPKLPAAEAEQYTVRQRARLEALIQQRPIVAPAVLREDVCPGAGPILHDTAAATPNNQVNK